MKGRKGLTARTVSGVPRGRKKAGDDPLGLVVCHSQNDGSSVGAALCGRPGWGKIPGSSPTQGGHIGPPLRKHSSNLL